MELHEPRADLPAVVLEQHRAISSLIEELAAVIWYHARAAVSADAELTAAMEHNRDEEIEHAMMLLEWLRRNFPGFDERMKTFLFTSGPLTELEQAGEAGGGPKDEGDAAAGSLNIGSLK
jgi:ferritin-like protein